MNDMRSVIVPKSDQINADDLLAGPITITITKVAIRPGTEQPVSVFFDGDSGKPWKPCKSMARVMVHCWGPDANEYTGRSMTLYCDPTVRWGGMEIGGIRISHMSHIKGTLSMALTMTKGSKKPFSVKLLKADAPVIEPPAITEPPRKTIRQWLAEWKAQVSEALAGTEPQSAVDAIFGSADFKRAEDKFTGDNLKELESIKDMAAAQIAELAQGEFLE